MGVSSLQQQILDPFVSETLESLASLANLPASASAAFSDDVAEFRFKGYAVVTQIEGAAPGKVLLHLYPETAATLGRRVFDAMTGSSDAVDDDDVAAALAEWANVLIGRASRTLEQSHLDVRFTPPAFVPDTQAMGAIMQRVVQIVSVPIHTQDAGRFYFNYLLHARSDG